VLQKQNFMNRATFISWLGRVPFLAAFLRCIAGRYPEGSVATITNGFLAGSKWKRSHQYVNGYWLGIYELPIQKCLVRELKAGDVFYDIGGNAGFFSLLGAKCVGPKGHVYIFEPLPANVDTIKSQISLNNIENSTVVEKAVSDKIGRVKFVYEGNRGQAHLNWHETDNGRGITLKTITLNEFAEKERYPDFIKMDIEGAEVLALCGADRLIKRNNRPKFLIELHGEDIAREVRKILCEAGYTLFTLDRSIIKASALPTHVLACSAQC